MGLLHVVRTGKGVLLNNLGFDSYTNFPKIDTTYFQPYLTKYFKNSCFKNPISEGEHQLIALGYERSYYIPRSMPEPENLTDKDISDLDVDYAHINIVRGLGVLFSLWLNLPTDTFLSTIDYEDNCMLYCNILAPFDDEHLELGKLSEKTYQEKIREFFHYLLPEDKYKNIINNLTISMCEEYAKD